MKLSCCTWSLPAGEEEAVEALQHAGFDCIDVRPFAFAEAPAASARARAGLAVCCLAASHGLVAAAGLDHPDPAARAGAIAHTERAIEHAARLGAEAVYLVPGEDAGSPALRRYAAVLGPLAQRAQERGVRLNIEHFPGRALPTVAATRAFVEQVDHPNLYVLLDIGHAQIEGITPAAAVERAGERLGYVHLDDNDGHADLHLGLLEGVLTEASLTQALAAARQIGYHGPVSLELSARLADPLASLVRSRQILAPLLRPG